MSLERIKKKNNTHLDTDVRHNDTELLKIITLSLLFLQWHHIYNEVHPVQGPRVNRVSGSQCKIHRHNQGDNAKVSVKAFRKNQKPNPKQETGD